MASDMELVAERVLRQIEAEPRISFRVPVDPDIRVGDWYRAIVVEMHDDEWTVTLVRQDPKAP